MFPKKNHFSHKKYFTGIHFPKLHYTYSFVIRRIIGKNVLGIAFLENLISVTKSNVFEINFAIISGWSALLLKLVLQCTSNPKPILKGDMKIQREVKKTNVYPTRVHVFWAIPYYITKKNAKDGIYVGCGSV